MSRRQSLTPYQKAKCSHACGLKKMEIGIAGHQKGVGVENQKEREKYFIMLMKKREN